MHEYIARRLARLNQSIESDTCALTQCREQAKTAKEDALADVLSQIKHLSDQRDTERGRRAELLDLLSHAGEFRSSPTKR